MLAGVNHGTGSSSAGTVSGDSIQTGGLVGTNEDEGAITGSHSSASVTVNPSDRVGGLTGRNHCTITQRYATGDVTGTGSGNGRMGGLVGWNEGGNISRSYASGNVTSSWSNAGGLVGHNTGTISATYTTGRVEIASDRPTPCHGSSGSWTASTCL